MAYQELEEMRLHEVLTPNQSENIRIMRVPGGWIYTDYTPMSTGGQCQDHMPTSVFVPNPKEQ